MKKRRNLLLVLALFLILALGLTACGEKKSDPTTVTIWHVYGGEVTSPLNVLVEEFNRTVGQKQGIRVRVDSVSNTNTIHESVLAAAYDDPGASELPDMFISYPKTVLALPDDGILVDYRDYFSDEELDAFLPEFLEEGTVNGRLTVLPIAKSAEILYVNQMIFNRFAAATGAKIEDLSTWEGLYALAEQYAKWSDGKCFFVHDYHFNYFQVGVESKGEDFFDENGLAFWPRVRLCMGALRAGRADRRPVARRRLRDRTAPHGRCHCVGCVLGKRPLLLQYSHISRQQLRAGRDRLHALSHF